MTLCRTRNDARSVRELSAHQVHAPNAAVQTGGTPASAIGPVRLLRLAEVIQMTGLGKTKIYELQSEGTFPMRVQITTHSVRWVQEEVQAWVTSRIAASTSLRVRGGAARVRRPPSP